MQPKAYYNENDPYAAQWLRNLIEKNLIAPGDVDERSIVDVRPHDLRGYTQCHFFAGIGGWPYAFRLARVPDNEPIWTGSCPCQPFSGVGKQRGFEDERHLWPVFFALIRECAPASVFGEQVASSLGREWFSRVRADLETLEYSVGAADLCSAGVAAPNIRQRLYWVAFSDSQQHDRTGNGRPSRRNELANGGAIGGMAYASCERRQQVPGSTPCNEGKDGRKPNANNVASSHGENGFGGLAYADFERRSKHTLLRKGQEKNPEASRRCATSGLGDASGEQAWNPRFPWRQSDTVACADGAIRRIEPGSFPLVARLPEGMGRSRAYLEALPRADQGNRQGRIRGYGNAINPVLAAEFIAAAREARNEVAA